jgi:hypothetical protein
MTLNKTKSPAPLPSKSEGLKADSRGPRSAQTLGTRSPVKTHPVGWQTLNPQRSALNSSCSTSILSPETPDAVPKLRSLILDLAIRGALVLQNPDDPPASNLLRLAKSQMKEQPKSRRSSWSAQCLFVNLTAIKTTIPRDFNRTDRNHRASPAKTELEVC